MKIADQLIILYKELSILIEKIQVFNKNEQLIIDSFEINLYSNHILEIKKILTKQKGITYVFENRRLKINFLEEVLTTKK